MSTAEIRLISDYQFPKNTLLQAIDLAIACGAQVSPGANPGIAEPTREEQHNA